MVGVFLGLLGIGVAIGSIQSGKMGTDVQASVVEVQASSNVSVAADGQLVSSRQLQVAVLGGCGAEGTPAQFRLTSPLFPERYPAGFCCTHVVDLVSPDVCQLEVTAGTFELPQSVLCIEDFLEIAGQRLCGSLLGIRRIRVTSPRVLINFRGSKGGGAYDLLVRQLRCASPSIPPQPCGGVHTAEEVVLQSPGFPGPYPPGVECVYSLRPVAGRDACQLELDLQQFGLEWSSGCAKDRLEISGYDVLCGSQSGVRRYPATPGGLDLRFVSDSDVTGSGFRIIVRQIPCTPTPAWPPVTPLPVYPPEPNTPPIPIYPPQHIYPPVTPPTPIYPPSQPDYPPYEPEYPPYEPEYPPYEPPTPVYPPYQPPATTLPHCCGRTYAQRHFYLTSPGFPYNVNGGTDCIYEILRSSSSVCRIEIQFKFFWVGEEDSYRGCGEDFLEVDQRRICDCRSGLILTSTFAFSVGETSKILRYRTGHGSKKSGFVLEVSQQECVPNWKRRSLLVADNTSSSPVYKAGARSVPSILGTEANLTSRQVHDSVENRCHLVVGAGENGTRRVECEVARPKRSARGERLPYPASNSGQLHLPWLPGSSCRQWGFGKWLQLAQEFFWRVVSAVQCPARSVEDACQEVSAAEGVITSPEYPRQYPAGARQCYRFRRLPDRCQLLLTFQDFSLEFSPNCVKDYLLLGGRWRMCGDLPAGTTRVLDMTTDGVDLRFCADRARASRGFCASFRQLPCRQPTVCGGAIRDTHFVLQGTQVAGCDGHVSCAYRLLRAGPSICEVHISLSLFNLVCGEESLKIGDQFYCGQQSGNLVKVPFYSDYVDVVYSSRRPGVDSQYYLVGQQVACNQLDLNVPLSRLGTACTVDLAHTQGSVRSPTSGQRACSYVFRAMPGRCSVRVNFLEFNMPSSVNCTASYLELDGRRYCGSELAGKTRDVRLIDGQAEVPYLLEDAAANARWNFSFSHQPC